MICMISLPLHNIKKKQERREVPVCWNGACASLLRNTTNYSKFELILGTVLARSLAFSCHTRD